MSSYDEENPEFTRVSAVLKELGKENLLPVFLSNELTDVVLDCLKTEIDMRNELTNLKDGKISRGLAITFSDRWFSHKKPGTATTEKVESTSRQSLSEGVEVSDSGRKKKKKSRKNGKMTSEENENKSVMVEKVETTASANERRKSDDLKENVSHDFECKNVDQERETKVEIVKSEGSLAKTTDANAKSVENTWEEKSGNVNNNIVLEDDAQKYSSWKGQGNTTQLREETISYESKEKELHPKSNDTDHLAVKNNTEKVLANNVLDIGNSKAVDRKFCDRRPFGQPTGNIHYEKGTAFRDVENKKIEFKALTQEKPERLPWKIMEKARVFICGILNRGGKGTIYFGVGDACDNATDFTHGEIIGLQVENLKDEISKAFQSMLDDHIRSDAGKMTRGGDMNCIKIHFVPVILELNQNSGLYVVEIEVQRDWNFCKAQVYYIEEWSKKKVDEKKTVAKYCLHDLFTVKKEKEQAYIRTCGATQSVKSSDITKEIKDPLSVKFEDWQVDAKGKSQKGMHNQDTEDIQKLSTNVRKSLRELQFKETSYILIANKVPLEYRGSNTIAFLQKIPWIAVFDLFDQSTDKDGLYYIVNETSDCARPIMKELEDFKDLKTNESISPGTTWIIRSKEMHESSWTRHSKDCLYRALSAYHEQSPTGHVHCVFLLLSNENFQEMADIIDSSFSIIGNDANKRISIISERKELGTKLIKFLKDDISKDIKPPCSVFGVPFDLLRNNVKALLGSIEFDEPEATTELPYLDGKLRPVRNKRIKSLTDLEVYIPHPNLSGELEDITKAKENFYMGNVISQMNLFHRDAIERTLEKKLICRIDECLRDLSSPEQVEQYVAIVTLRYESGSGATTLGRQILWKKKETYRCAVVKTISEKTDYQINQLQTFKYEALDANLSLIPPILVLVDNITEQQVHHLSDMLTRNKTKCVLLSTIPVDKLTKDDGDDCTLGKLDKTEIKRVRGVLSTLRGERKKEAAKVLDREKRFMWLGLELFGRNYTDIGPRLSKHIRQVLSQSLTDQLKDAYQMILHFCCLLDYYSKRRSIYPQPCVEDILYVRGGLETDGKENIDKIHDKFGGLLLEDVNESVGYYGWRPAHALVGEVVREEMDLFKTAKNLCEQMDKGRAYVKKYLIEDTVDVFLKREKITESPADNENDTYLILDGDEDDVLGTLEIRRKYSQLILDVLPNQEEQYVKKALDLLITLNENVEGVQHKAKTCQQIARMFAYEIGMNQISEEVLPLVNRIDKVVCPGKRPSVLPENGFDIAHRVIDVATKLQETYVHHLVTKATFYRIKLKHHENTIGNSTKTEELKDVIKEAINTTKKGIDLFDDALNLKTKNRDSFFFAMIGKIHTIVDIVEMFKKLPFFSLHPDGPNESYKNFLTFRNHPGNLKTLLTEEDMDYFLSLINTAVQLLNEFLGEIQFRRKLSYTAHELKGLENARFRAMKLRTKFYEVTNLDRTNIEKGDLVLKEDIVNDLLYKNHESPYSSWMRLTPDIIRKIHTLLENAIQTETNSHTAMLVCARAALQQDVNINKLDELVQSWCRKYPNSEWAHMFSYMIHFPVPNGSLKADIATVKRSVELCRVRIPHFRPGYRRSGAEYLLGKGVGVNSIIPPHKVAMPEAVEPKLEFSRSRDVHLETEFWRSRPVYDKLERLRGKKKKKGVLSYREIEIPFDNDRYPQESRDELWFCLGFTITGPYAYDPIDKDTYQEIQEKFSEEKITNNRKKDKYSDGSSKAWNVQNLSVSRSSSAKPKATFTNKSIPRKTQETREEAQATSSVSSSTDFRPTAEKGEEYWKTDPRFRKTVRANEGHQKTFYPKYLKHNNVVHHGAQVQGAAKSVECYRHTSKDFPKDCTFAHPGKGDPVRQTVCDLCTNKERLLCDKKEHSRHYYDLGPFLTLYR